VIGGYIIHGYEFTNFEKLSGKLLTLIDSIGLQETQNKALKDLIKQEVWGLWEDPHRIYKYVMKEDDDGYELEGYKQVD